MTKGIKRQRAEVETERGEIPVVIDGDGSSLVLVLAPGAGAGMDHPFMETVATGIARRGIGVVRFDFHYMAAGRKSPDRTDVLEATYSAVAARARNLGDGSFFLGGKSMGGRIASQIAAKGTACDGLVFLGYPLHPPGKPERMRDAHLHEIECPMLFVEGTRDPFCPLPTLEKVRALLSAPADVHVVDDGDHSFKVRKSSGRTSEQALDEVVDAVCAWVSKVAGET